MRTYIHAFMSTHTHITCSDIHAHTHSLFLSLFFFTHIHIQTQTHTNTLSFFLSFFLILQTHTYRYTHIQIYAHTPLTASALIHHTPYPTIAFPIFITQYPPHLIALLHFFTFFFLLFLFSFFPILKVPNIRIRAAQALGVACKHTKEEISRYRTSVPLHSYLNCVINTDNRELILEKLKY